jgi:AraC-like DNA-binding protein
MKQIIQKTTVEIGNAGIEIILQGGFAEQGSHRTTDMHNHHNYELHFIEEGEYIVELETGEMTVEKNECLLIPKKVYHRIIGKGEALKRLSFEFNIHDIDKSGDTYNKYKEILSNISAPVIVSCDNNALKSISSRMGLILGEERKSELDAYFTLALIDLFSVLSAKLGNCEKNTQEKIAEVSLLDSDYIIIRAVTFIRENCTRKLSVSEVADEVNLSVRQLQRTMSEKLGETFSSLLARCRINAAKIAISNDKFRAESLEQIAYSVGFSNYVSFYNSFKAIVGVSPYEYRSMI